MHTDPQLNALARVLSPWINPLDPFPEPAAWPRLIERANRQGLTPALAPTLRSKDVGTGTAWDRLVSEDPAAASYLDRIHALNARRNTVFWDQLIAITGAFNRAGIEPLLLKGAAELAEGIYPSAGARWLADWDLQVPASQLATACRILEDELGYAQPPASPDEAPAGALNHQLAPHHHPDHPVKIELHRTPLHRRPPGLNEAFEVVAEYERIRWPSEWNGIAWRFTPTWHLAHAFLHAEIGHRGAEHGVLNLRHAYHFTRLSARDAARIDWQGLTHWLRQRELEPTFRAYLYLNQRVFGQPWPLATAPGAPEQQALNRRLAAYRIETTEAWTRFVLRRHLGRILAQAHLERRYRVTIRGPLALGWYRARYIGHLLGKHGLSGRLPRTLRRLRWHYGKAFGVSPQGPGQGPEP